MDFLVSIVAFPFRMLRKLFKHPKLGVAVFVGIGVLMMIGQTIGNKPKAKQAEVRSTANISRKYEERTPNTKNIIQTDSRLYYADSFTNTSGIITAPTYWDYSKNKWVYHKTALKLDPKYYGKIEVFTVN